jgi:hypothetical protein
LAIANAHSYKDIAAALSGRGSLRPPGLELRDRAAHHEQPAKHFQMQEIGLREGL